MVAIVTGKGAGLGNGSVSVLGSQGQIGSASMGRGGERVFVNAATGNLVIDNTDEMLVGRGPDAVVERTYNSLGAWDGDNSDNWRAGLYRRVYGLTGTYGASGSTVTRTDWDGSEVVYTWNATESAYLGTDDGGAYDKLTKSSSTWTWTDGDTQTTETYDDGNSGRITATTDANGNSLTYTYTGSLLTQVTTSDGEYTLLHYGSGGTATQLQYLETHTTSPTATTTRVYYDYDGSGRLSKVSVNLDPTDNSKTTGSNYEINYAYDTTSGKVATITQTDGSSLSFAYTSIGGVYRVTSITETIATGVTRTTTIAYDTTNRLTTITDALGQVTALAYDANGNLLSAVMPPSGTNDPAPAMSFSYDGSGNVATATSNGNTVTYSYDSHGNRTLERDSLGNTVTRTFSTKNEMLTEVRYTVPDPDGAGSGTPSGAMTAHYVYDSHSNLRFRIDADGRVTEHVYNGYGQETATINHVAGTYSSSFTETALASWVSALSDKTGAQRTETVYDFRGNISTVTSYAKLTSLGAFDTSSECSQATYIYSAHGELLSRQLIGSSATETYAYDGLSRIKYSTDFNSVSTTITYTDSSDTIAVALSNGLIQTSTYDKAGDLLAYAESGSGMTTVTSTYGYDTLGRLRFTTASKSASEALVYTGYFYYDADGRKVADIDALGAVTEYRHDAAGNVTSTTAYANKLTSTQLASLISSGAPSSVTFASVRPSADATNDRWEWRIYDATERLIRTIDGTGAVIGYAYDGASQLTSTTQYATRLSTDTIAALKTQATSPAGGTNYWANPGDGSLWSTYNLTVASAGTLDGSNAFQLTTTTSTYHISGTFASSFAIEADETVSFSITAKGVGSSTAVELKLDGYDEDADESDLTVSISGPGSATFDDIGYWYITGLSTTVASRITITRHFHNDTTVEPGFYVGYAWYPNGNTTGMQAIVANPVVQIVQAPIVTVPTTDTANDRITRDFYDNSGRLTGTLDAEGYLTQILYDAAGRKTQTIAYSGATSTTYRASGTFAQLLGSLTVDNAHDIHNWWVYDDRGLLRGTLDGEGNLTRYDYTAAGYLSQQTLGQNISPATLIATAPTFATLPSAGSAILSVTAWTRNAYGQPLTEVTTLTGSTTTTTTYTYDSMRRLTATVTQSGGTDPRTYAKRYDLQGHLTSELSGIGSAALAALGGSPTQTQIDTVYTQYGWTYAYDSAGRLVSKTGPAGTGGGSGEKALYYYNADSQLIYEVSPLGEVVEYRYDTFGERCDTIVYANRLSSLTSMVGGLDTSLVTARLTTNSATDSPVHVEFNVDGTVKQVTDALSNVTAYAYDAFDEKVTETDPFDTSTTIQTSFTYDRKGLLKTELVDSASGHLGLTTTYGYDAFGRAVTLTNALSKVTTSTYDRDGLVLTTTDALSHATTYEYDARRNLVAVTDANSRITRYVYDKANRRIATIDALGELSVTTYDADGRVIATRDYLNTVSLTGLSHTVAENNTTFTTAIANTNAADHIARFAYDKDGQLRFTMDALGHVVERAYDANGNVVHVIAYDGTVTATPSGGVYSESWFAGQVSSLTASTNRISRSVYDADNRVNYTIDAVGMVTFFKYDSAGRFIKQTTLATLYTTSGDQSLATMDSWASGHTNAADRTSRAYYDRKGQLAYSVDAGGYVTRYDYDKRGNVKAQIAYMAASSLSDTTTLANMASAYTTPTSSSLSDSRRTDFAYDSAGRLTDTIDYLDFNTTPTTITTHLVLDAMGEITASTQAYGTDASTTAYTYDDVGRVTGVTRGSGTSEASTSLAYYDAAGQKVATVDGDHYLCTYVYDAAGQLTSELHYANTTTGTIATTTAVATLVSNTTADSGRDATTSYTYGAFGQLVKTVDPRGNASFAYYDTLGRVFRQVDAEKYVTDTGYTNFGEVASVKRWANALTGTVTETTVPSNPTADTTHDATTSFLYDNDGRVTKSTEAEGDSRTTGSVFTLFNEQFSYDAFGDQATVRNEEYGRIVGGSALDTTVTYTYDKLGHVLTETLPVTTRNSSSTTISVVNSYRYDARGNLIKTVEAGVMDSSGAIVSATSGVEARSTSYAYDALDRLITTTHDSVTIVNNDGTSSTSQPVVEHIVYDRRGNVIETIDAAGAHSQIWYDHLDRQIATAIQSDLVSGNKKGTLSRYVYDANDNLTSAKTYGDLITMPSDATDSIPSPVDSTKYRQTTYAYDLANRQTSSSVASLTTGEWSGTAYTTATGTVASSTAYDKAGNAVTQTDGRGNILYTWYDKLGRAVAQIDQENYLTVWTRDAEGNVLAETRYANKVTGSFTTATAASSLSGLLTTDATNDRVTTFTYDRNGNRLTEARSAVIAGTINTSTGALVTPASATSTVTYAYNGLGEVLTRTEANIADAAVSSTVHDSTTYAYDAAGRLTLETGTALTDYLGTAVTPTTAYTYDGLGDLLTTTVAHASGETGTSDRVTTYTYGAGGRLATMTDAAGFTHTYGYDIAGRTVRDSYDRLKSDATTVTEAQVTRYDLAGRVITQTEARYVSSAWSFSDGAHNYDAVRIQYNAYGDVTGRGLTAGPDATAAYQESYDYDAAGRLWTSNAGDGVTRYYLYDKAGNQTLAIARSSGSTALAFAATSDLLAVLNSAGGTTASNTVTTLTKYDKRGQAVMTGEPDRQLASAVSRIIIHAKTYNAFGEVASEIDPRAFDSSGTLLTTSDSHGTLYSTIYTKLYSYNTMGRMVQKQMAMVDVTAENGGITYDTRPTETYAYDVAGRLIAVTDANSHVTTRLLLAGTGHGDSEALVTKEFHPDTGVFQTKYDVFGDARVLRNEMGSDETQTFDKLDRLLTDVHRGALLTDTYTYDGLGERITHVQSWSGGSQTEKADYDAKGRIVSQIAFGGDTTTTAYVWDSSITARDASSTAMATAGGWTATTTYANTRTLIESTDTFGHVTARTDLGGHSSTYTYDRAGRTTGNATGADTNTYSWFNTGLIASLTNVTATTSTSVTSVQTSTYDAAGNKLTEAQSRAGSPVESATSTYDAESRLLTWSESGNTTMPAADLAYKYDAAGNVRESLGHGHFLDAQGATVSGGVTYDTWYAYDVMNRMTAQGSLVSGAIVASLAITYNAAGRRATETTTSSNLVWSGWVGTYKPVHAMKSYLEAGEDPEFWDPEHSYIWAMGNVTYSGKVVESYAYDAEGHLTTVSVAQATATADGSMILAVDNVTLTSPVTVGAYTYDALGRLTHQADTRVHAGGTQTVYDHAMTYNGSGQVATDTVIQVQETTSGTTTVSDTYTYVTTNLYGTVGTTGYALGQVVSATTVVSKNGVDSAAPNTSTANTYAWYAGPTLSGITFNPDTSGSTTTGTANTLSASGVLTASTITDSRTRTISFTTDALGQVIRRDEADGNGSAGDPHQIWYRFNGRQLAMVSNDYAYDTSSYQDSVADRLPAAGTAAFHNGQSYGGSYAQFGEAFAPITSYAQGAGGGGYTAQGGETLSAVAAQMWGDSSLWYLLAQANGLSGDAMLAAGQHLSIPAGVQRNSFTATTFKPYDPAEALGSITPGTPKVKGNKCGVFGQILAAVVSVAVAFVTAPFIGIPAAAMLGDAASQGILIATGNQQKFNWGEVVKVGVESLFMPVPQSGASLQSLAINFAAAAVVDAAGQGVAKLVGLQKHFDWAEVASAGVGSAVGNYVGAKVKLPGTLGHAVSTLTKLTASDIANAATRSLITGTDFGDNFMAALPQTLAQTLGGTLEDVTHFSENATSLARRLSPHLGDTVLHGIGKVFRGHKDAPPLTAFIGHPDLGARSSASSAGTNGNGFGGDNAAEGDAGIVVTGTRVSGSRNPYVPVYDFEDLGASDATYDATPRAPQSNRESERHGRIIVGDGVVFPAAPEIDANPNVTLDQLRAELAGDPAASGWHKVVVPRSGVLALTVKGTSSVRDGVITTNENSGDSYSVVVATINGGGEFWEKDALFNNQHYRFIGNTSGELLDGFDPVMGYSGSTYMSHNSPTGVTAQLTYSIIPVEAKYAKALGWRGWQFSENSDIRTFGTALWRQEVATPNSVDTMFARHEIEKFADEEYLQNQLRAFDWQAGAMAAPLLVLASLPMDGPVAAGYGVTRTFEIAPELIAAKGASGLGDLTVGEAASIQNVVNQAGRPLEVVGSAARAARRVGSDIDYVVPPGSLKYYEGLETHLPGIDMNHGIIPGYGNPHIGPVIRFEPKGP